MQCLGFALPLVMSFFGRPAFAQSSAMSVVTLPAPTTATPETTSSISDATPSIVPSILYPAGNPILNNIDTLEVYYISPWPLVDLTVSCGETTTDTDQFHFTADNLPQNGPYDISPIQQSFTASTYPIFCQLTLGDASNTANTMAEGQFIMTSTAGSPSRYAQSITAAIAAPATEPARSETLTSSNPTASTSSPSSRTSTSHTSDATAAAAASSTSSSDPTSQSTSSSSSSSSGLSSGAKAGIAISIVILLALLAALLFFLLRYRRSQRRLQQTESALEKTQASAAAAAADYANEKAYLDSILKAVGKPDTSAGGRIVVADLGSRKSGDWRTFFATKANSAVEAVRTVAVGSSRPGSRGNSRPGSSSSSRRISLFGSRPGTRDENVPAVPTLPAGGLPSPSLGGWESSKDGSQVGLVSGGDPSTEAGNVEKKYAGVRRKPVPELNSEK